MTTLVVRRPPSRRPAPPVPRHDVAMAAPPALGSAGGIAWWTYLFPVLGSAGALLFVVINPQPLYLVAGGLFLIGSLAMGAGMYVQQRSGQRRRLARDRERYLDYLHGVRDEAVETARSQRVSAMWCDPPPEQLWTIAASPARVWERRPPDADFLTPRLGLAPGPLATALRLDPAGGPLAERDAVSL
jgi:DNA segregation ATPase FtsK/SpoIIIE, S-DNA-T family